MIRTLILALVLSCISGCSIHLNEASIIAQDENVETYDEISLVRWQKLFEHHKLTKIELPRENGSVTLHGLKLDSPESEDVIFFIPGNGMRVAKGGMRALQSLSALGTDIVIFDRRGLGASNGHATFENQLSDAIASHQYIKRQLRPRRIIIHGYSLGSFVAAHLSKHAAIDALVLQGSATNFKRIINESTPWYIKPFINLEIDEIFETFDNGDVVSKYYQGPLLIIAGEKDKQTPAILSQQLHDLSISDKKELVILEDASHESMFYKDRFITTYSDFLNAL